MYMKFRDLIHLIGQMHGSPTYVNVWNCQASWIVGNVSLEEYEDRLTDKQKEALEKLAEYVIYTVNDGAINISGQYQLDQLSYRILGEILGARNDEDVERAIEQIQTPTDEDFEALAREIISILKKEEYEGRLVRIYNSMYIWKCWDGCQGYHREIYLTQLNGRLYECGDNYYSHHACSPNGTVWTKEIDEEEALQRLTNYLSTVAERYNYTKVELQDPEDWFEEYLLIDKCDEHGHYFYYIDEPNGCPRCR